MPEFPRPEWMASGHLFDQNRTRFDLYILSLIFLGDKAFAELNNQNLCELASEFSGDEISRLIISTAVAIRISDDKGRSRLDKEEYELWLSELNLKCGFFKDTKKPLYLRDACNKIIHAQKINFDIEIRENAFEFEENCQSFINPKLHLYGEQSKEEWGVELDIIAYVLAGNKFLAYY